MGKLFTLPSEVARLIAAQRRTKVRVCQVCGTEFTTVGRGLYCSRRCRDKAYYRTHPKKSKPEGYWREYYRKNREKILARRKTTGAGESAPTGR
jgi:hypothetical protein